MWYFWQLFWKWYQTITNTLKMFIIIEKRYSNDAIFGCKDIKCESCGKLFTQAGNMRRHIKTLLQLFMKKWKN